MTLHARRQKAATGSVAGAFKSPRVAISFDKAIFDRIAGEAQRRQIPFAEVVRERLIEAYRSVEDGKDLAHSEGTQI